MSPGCATRRGQGIGQRIRPGDDLRRTVPARLHARHHRVGVDALDRLLARGIDGRGIDHVGIVEGG
jgi:hypothetical protein